jgi:transcriptional/translational regulatory protein YebC/TACO1
VDASTVDEDKLMTAVLDAGGEDVQRDGDHFEILTDPATFHDVVDALQKAGIATLSADLGLVPDVYVPVQNKSDASAVMKFVAALEEKDDVQAVYTNMDVSDSLLEELEKEE